MAKFLIEGSLFFYFGKITGISYFVDVALVVLHWRNQAYPKMIFVINLLLPVLISIVYLVTNYDIFQYVKIYVAAMLLSNIFLAIVEREKTLIVYFIIANLLSINGVPFSVFSFLYVVKFLFGVN